MVVRIFKYSFLILLLGLCLFIALTFYFNNVQDQEDISPSHTIVLTGDKGRIQKGLEWLKRDDSRSILISGVYRYKSETSFFKRWAIPLEDQKHLFLDRKSRSTRDNAIESIKWLRERGISEAVVLTHNYHIVRTRFEFLKRAGEIKLKFRTIPSKNLYHFWRIMIKEYLKFFHNRLYDLIAG